MYNTCEEIYKVNKTNVTDVRCGIEYVSQKTFEQDAGCDERCQYVCKILQSFPEIEKNIRQKEEGTREGLIRDRKLEENTNFRIKRKR